MSTVSNVSLEKVGARHYVVGNSYPLKDALKAAGCHWDGDRRQWWIGTKKVADVESIVSGASSVDSGASPAKPKVGDDSKVVGKAKYKGRTYYVLWVGQCKSGDYKAHLTVLDGSIDFWANCERFGGTGDGDVAAIVKTYAPREYRGRLEYTTLGSIRRFIERQKDPATARGECCECGSYGPVGESCKDCGGEGSYC